MRVFRLKTPHSKTNEVQISETALNQFPLSFIHKYVYALFCGSKAKLYLYVESEF